MTSQVKRQTRISVCTQAGDFSPCQYSLQCLRACLYHVRAPWPSAVPPDNYNPRNTTTGRVSVVICHWDCRFMQIHITNHDHIKRYNAPYYVTLTSKTDQSIYHTAYKNNILI